MLMVFSQVAQHRAEVECLKADINRYEWHCVFKCTTNSHGTYSHVAQKGAEVESLRAEIS